MANYKKEPLKSRVDNLEPEKEPPVVQETVAEKPQENNPVVLKTTAVKHAEYTAEIVQDFYGHVDPFYLEKRDPDFEYRFLRDDSKNITLKTGNLLFQKGGWQVCPKDHLVRLGISDRELSADGFLRRGDTVLAFMPKSLSEKKMAFKKEQATLPMNNIERVMNEGDKSLAGLGNQNMRGIETGKQLGMK